MNMNRSFLKSLFISLLLTVICCAAFAQPNITVLHSFNPNKQGKEPTGRLLLASDGNFYGTARTGGANGDGMVFRLTPGGVLTVLHAFSGTDGGNPRTGLIQGSDGNLYGTTDAGTANQLGTIFRMSLDGALATVHSFVGSDGYHPNDLIQANDGNIYGADRAGGSSDKGTIFSVTPAGNYTVLHSFSGSDGYYPAADLVQAPNGNLYGTTSQGGANGYGTVFRISVGGALTTLHSFTNFDGAKPLGGLTLANDGNLYGTTSSGGIGTGTLFRIAPNDAISTVYRFNSSSQAGPVGDLIQASDNNLYGVMCANGSGSAGAAYSLTLSGTFTSLSAHLGDGIMSGLILGPDGAFYGTNTPVNSGLVYRLDSSGAGSTLTQFESDEGHTPQIPVTQGADGSLYGVSAGGLHGGGVLYNVGLDGTYQTLINFSASGSIELPDNLLLAPNGDFYAMSSNGGANGYGGVFEITPAGAVTTLYSSISFLDTSGTVQPPIEDSAGNLIGAAGGGSTGLGKIFTLSPAGVETLLFDQFTAADGGVSSGVVSDLNGNLYGATSGDGGPDYGCVYKLTPDGTFTRLHVFTNSEGQTPLGVLFGSDGALYGTTLWGGTNNDGTIFRLGTDGVLTTLHTFSGSDGRQPAPGLALGLDGSFYGATVRGGSTDSGTLYQITPSGIFQSLYSFGGFPDGFAPSGLTLASDGHFYGTTYNGGRFNSGMMYRLNMITDTSPPTTSATVTGTAGNGGWYKTPVQMTLAAADPDDAPGVLKSFYTLDGGPTQTYAASVPISSEGVHTITYWSSDPTGNVETAHSLTVKIDTASPASTASTVGVQVTLAATDAVSGVQSVFYAIDGGTTHTYTLPFSVSGTGLHNIAYWSTDIAGNSEAANTLPFIVNAPLTSISPALTYVDAPAFTLTVNGTGFLSGAVVTWNGASLTTIYVSSTQLTAFVPKSGFATPGTVNVAVTSPSPNSGTSPAKPFAVLVNPVPTLSSLAPSTAIAGTAGFTLTAIGSNFMTTSVINWNGVPLTTTYVSSMKLTALVSASLIALPGSAVVVVATPSPGGGTSPFKTFTITAPALSALTLTPTSLTGGAVSTGKVTLAAPALAGGQAVTLTTTNSSAAPVPSSVFVPGGATFATFPVNTAAVSADTAATITATLGAVSKPAALTVKAPVLSMLTLSPTSIFGGFGSTGTVTLTGPAPAGGLTVTLGSSNTAAASVGPSVNVLAGATTAQFPITTTLVSAAANITITATLGTTAKTAVLMVKAITPTMLVLSPTSLYGGLGAIGTVTINSPAPAGGLTVTLGSSNMAVAGVGPTVTIVPGATSVPFSITTSPVSASTGVTLSAACGGVTKTAVLTVKPPVLASVSLDSTSVHGGTTANLTVTLTSPAPSTGTTVTFTSSKAAAASIQANVVIPFGATSATVTVNTSVVTMSTAVTLTSVAGGVSKTAMLTVTP